MFKNSTILLTGGSGYIGGHLHTFFAAQGATVITPSRSECELSTIGATSKYLESLHSKGIRLDYIINNAANQIVENLLTALPETIAEIMQVNFNAVAETYAFVKSSSWTVQSIVNISSIEAVHARAGHSIYGASKAALESLTRSAAIELAPTRSNALRLGLISRPDIESSWPEGVASWRKATPLLRMGELADITEALHFLLTAPWITGEILTLDGGNSASPNW